MEMGVSVVVVSDHGCGGLGRAVELVAALRGQGIGEPFEILLVEEEARAAATAAAFAGAPELRVIGSAARGSYALKNEGVRAARGRLIAMIDADCTPQPGWLASLLGALRADPRIVAVSGRTLYAGASPTERAFALLSRAYVDRGRAGETEHISNNNVGFRRDAFLAAPLPTTAGPFASPWHAAALRRNGGRLWFEPRARVTHAFAGVAMERDIRRNGGWAAIALRQRDPTHRNAWLARLGHGAIPLLAAASAVRGIARVATLRRQYELRPLDVPLAVYLAVTMSRYEIQGMRQALRGEMVTDTEYR